MDMALVLGKSDGVFFLLHLFLTSIKFKSCSRGVSRNSVKIGASKMSNNYNRFGNKSAAPRTGAQASSAPAAGAPAARGPKPEILLSSGLFRPKSEKSKAVASVVTEITQDIPAGTTVYLDLYQNEEVADGKPLYKIQLKKKA